MAADGSTTFYFDPATMENGGRFRRVREMVNLAERGLGRELSRQWLAQFDCTEKRYRILSLVAFPEHFGGGSEIVSTSNPTEWVSIPANTISMERLRLFCSM